MKSWKPSSALAAAILLVVPAVCSARVSDVAACNSDATTLCLNNGRFQVRVQWATAQGQSGAGQAVALTPDTGYFWFFSANNVEMVIKVVDGRDFNSRFWVFAGGLTNVAVAITVTDTQTGAVKVYTNPQGVAFQPIQDTNAFAGAAAPGSESRVQSPRSKVEDAADSSSKPDPGRWTLDLGPQAAQAACAPDATTLCLNNGRFQVRVQWATPQGQSGVGQAVSLTSDTGHFWFFSASNVEMIVKVVTGCAFNSRIWVFAGGLTNVNVVMSVTDTQTGAVKTYTNAQGVPFQPIQDTDAFAGCLSATDFAGNWTGNWVNNTFGSSGSASMAVTINTSNQTFVANLMLSGNVFGSGPVSQTFSGAYSTSAPTTFTQNGTQFGNVSVTIASGGAITGSATNIPNASINRMDFTGTATSQKITINYTVTFTGGGGADGTLTLNHVN